MTTTRLGAAPVTLQDQTVRQSFRTTIGGSKARVRRSDLSGRQPLTRRNVHIARCCRSPA